MEYLDRFDPHDTLALYYDGDSNRFIEGDFGTVVYNMYNYVTPNQILLFKKEKGIMIFPDVTNSYLVELIYPDYLNEKCYS